MNHKDLLKSIGVSNANVLGAGEHRVTNAVIIELTDRRDMQGKVINDKVRPWKDETPQIGITFRCAKGVFTHRFSLLGFVSKKDEDYAPQAGDVIASSEGHDEQYVLRNGKRVVSARKSATAQGKLSSFLGTLKTGKENAEEALAEASGMETTIVLKEFEGRVEYSYAKASLPKEVAVGAMSNGEQF